MRIFSSGFQSKLASNIYSPVVFCRYELVTYVSGTTAGTGTQIVTNYFWSERAITYSSQAYESRIVKANALEQVMDTSRQAFGDMSLQIANFPTNLTGAIQSGMKCVIYLGFEDSVGVVTDAEVIFTGAVEGNIEITEDSVSFSLTDIAHTYDRQLPDLISREQFPVADPDAIGDTKPIIMGRVRDLTCRPVASGLASILALPATAGMNVMYLSHDIGWWADTFVGTTLGKFPLMIINTPDLDEEIRITSLEYVSSSGLWKANLESTLTKNHLIGDTVYQKLPCPYPETPNNLSTKYAYLVADHAVDSITNVKVDGVPVPFKAFKNLVESDLFDDDMCADWNLPFGKAYVLVGTKPAGIAVTGSGGLAISDTIAVDDKIEVLDSLGINDDGHKHSGLGVEIFTWTITYTYSALYTLASASPASCNGLKINARSGSTTVVIADLPPTGGGISLSSPIIFTSTSPELDISALVTCGIIYYAEFQVERESPDGVSTFDVNSTGATSAFYSTFEFPEYFASDSTGFALTGVDRVGDVLKSGTATKTGSVRLSGGNSSADIFVGQKVTCDVRGNCDGSTGYVQPNEQIKKLINLYATNPISGTEGSADIVQYVNQSEMNTQFQKVYNTDNLANTANANYPFMNNPTSSTLNPSPTTDLGNTDGVEGFNAIDFAITEPNRLRDVVGDMLFHSNSFINWQNGIAYIRHSSDSITADGTVGSSDLLIKSTKLGRAKASDLATEVDVRYNYSQVTDYSRRFDYAEKVGKGRTYTKTKLDAIRARGVHKKERTYDLAMAGEQVTAELVAKRLYDDKSTPKYIAGVSSTLKNLAFEVGDYININVPIYANSVLSKGFIERKTLQFGSAIDKQPDLIHLQVKESHVGDFYLATDLLTDSLSISEGTPIFTLNDVNTKFKTLTDSLGITEYVGVEPVVSLGDTVSLTESLSFEKELRLTDSMPMTDFVRRFSGILFWYVDLDDTLAISENVTVSVVDGTYELDTYIDTDLTTIGVYE